MHEVLYNSTSHPFGSLKIKKKWKTTSFGEDLQKMETLYIAGGRVRCYSQLLWKTSLTVSQKVKQRITI